MQSSQAVSELETVQSINSTIPPLQASSHSAWSGLIVWGIAAFFYGYEFLLRVSPSVMQNELMTRLGVDAATFAFLDSLYYWAYAGMQIPAGMLIDRFGPRRILTLATLFCALGTVLFGVSSDVYVVGGARFIVGFGSAFALMGTFKLAASWFAPNRYASLAGTALLFGAVGSILGQGPLALMIERLGIEPSSSILAAVGGVCTVALWLFVRDHPPHMTALEIASSKSASNPFKTLAKVVANRQSLFIAAFAAFIYIPIGCFMELWSIPFIMKACECDKVLAATIASSASMGMVFGAPFFGWLSDYLRNRTLILKSVALLSLALISAMVYVPNLGSGTMSVLMALLGAVLGGHIVLFALMREANMPNAAAVASGFANSICMLLPALFKYIIGVLLTLTNGGVELTSQESMSLESFHISLATIPVALIIAYILISFAKETHAKQVGYTSDL